MLVSSQRREKYLIYYDDILVRIDDAFHRLKSKCRRIFMSMRTIKPDQKRSPYFLHPEREYEEARYCERERNLRWRLGTLKFLIR